MSLHQLTFAPLLGLFWGHDSLFCVIGPVAFLCVFVNFWKLQQAKMKKAQSAFKNNEMTHVLPFSQ